MAKTAPSQSCMAVIFDFDGTLGPDTTSSFMESLGIEAKEFWSKGVQPRLDEGWDPMTAQFFCMLERGRDPRTGEQRITRERLAAFGRQLQPFEGVPRVLERLRSCAQEIDQRIEVELYIVSCGIGEIIHSTSIADRFKGIWANELHFNERGEAVFPKVIVSHTEKNRYLYKIAKGIGDLHAIGSPFAAGRSTKDTELRIPLDQIIYVGDGLTDMPCFSAIYSGNGVALGIYKEGTKEKWGKSARGPEQGRVSNLAKADFREGSELTESLLLAASSVAHRIRLREKAWRD